MWQTLKIPPRYWLGFFGNTPPLETHPSPRIAHHSPNFAPRTSPSNRRCTEVRPPRQATWTGKMAKKPEMANRADHGKNGKTLQKWQNMPKMAKCRARHGMALDFAIFAIFCHFCHFGDMTVRGQEMARWKPWQKWQNVILPCFAM